MQSRSLSFVSAHQARNSSVKALWCESTGVIAPIGRSHRRLRVRETSQFRGQKIHGNDTERQEDCVLVARARVEQRAFDHLTAADRLGADGVRGRTITSWPSVRTDFRNAGANWVGQLGRSRGGRMLPRAKPVGVGPQARRFARVLRRAGGVLATDKSPQTSHSRTRPREC